MTPYPHHVYVKLQPWDCGTRALWYSKDTKDGTARIFDAIEEYTRAWYWRDVEFARLLPQPVAEEILEHI